MNPLKAFGQRKLQPFLMKLAINKRIQGICERLLPLVTVEDCRSCPLLSHCQAACVVFRNLCRRVGIDSN